MTSTQYGAPLTSAGVLDDVDRLSLERERLVEWRRELTVLLHGRRATPGGKWGTDAMRLHNQIQSVGLDIRRLEDRIDTLLGNLGGDA